MTSEGIMLTSVRRRKIPDEYVESEDPGIDNPSFTATEKETEIEPEIAAVSTEDNVADVVKVAVVVQADPGKDHDSEIAEGAASWDDNMIDVETGSQLSKQDDGDSEKTEGCVDKVQRKMSTFWGSHGDKVDWGFKATLILGYSIYFGFALEYEFGSESSVRLLWMSMLVVFCCIVVLLRDFHGEQIDKYIFQPIVRFVNRHYTVCKWLFISAVVLGFSLFIIIDIALDKPEHLVSLAGYGIYVLIFFIFSAYPSQVRWRPVLWGLGLQFTLALLVLRTVWGYEVFKWLGDRVQEFMAYADEGSEFVFGESYMDHMFAFQVLPVVIFFSATISVLYYLGWMQAIIMKIAWVMIRTMGTTAAESVNAAGNIFIGQTEAPLLIKPLLPKMTSSEIHAVMTGGFGTIAGAVMATYIMFGVPANHLITASVMAAPCCLAVSKLFYPEVQKVFDKEETVELLPSPQRNALEAASVGASTAIPLVANIAANLIAFIALLAFFNTTLTWMGHRIGMWPPDYPELTFELICSYALWPFAFFMGVIPKDCRKVAELIGTKVFINEFVAYTELGILIENTDTFNDYNGTWVEINDDIYLEDTNTTLVGGTLEDRSIVIATYALCGFANFSSIGMVIGSLGAMVPDRKSEISGMALRAMIAGNFVSFMNGCTAGLLYQEET